MATPPDPGSTKGLCHHSPVEQEDTQGAGYRCWRGADHTSLLSKKRGGEGWLSEHRQLVTAERGGGGGGTPTREALSQAAPRPTPPGLPLVTCGALGAGPPRGLRTVPLQQRDGQAHLRLRRCHDDRRSRVQRGPRRDPERRCCPGAWRQSTLRPPKRKPGPGGPDLPAGGGPLPEPPWPRSSAPPKPSLSRKALGEAAATAATGAGSPQPGLLSEDRPRRGHPDTRQSTWPGDDGPKAAERELHKPVPPQKATDKLARAVGTNL